MTAHVLAQLPGEALSAPRHVVVPLDERGTPSGRGAEAAATDLPRLVAAVQDTDPAARFVWEDTRSAYPPLLAQGVEIHRCHDLGLAGQALRAALSTLEPPLIPARRAPELPAEEAPQDALFAPPGRTPPATPEAVASEYAAQLAAMAAAGRDGAKLRLLVSLDSAGSLIAEEMRADGVPWDRAEHGRLLEEWLGPRVPHGTRPARLADLAETLQLLLDSPRLNPDSQPELLRALRGAGLDVKSTRKWDLQEVEHPAIEPLLRYKKLSRLASASGWAWLDAWVRDGRFHPEYIVAGVVTGRWASLGGGALQIPHDVRTAVRADPGHVLVVADASQLEPRVLAAISGDAALAQAARGTDLYQAIADRVFGGDRPMAKVAMLGAMYGGTTGPSAAMAPRLAAAYPRATALLENAARTGEHGGTVRTWLGRTSPVPSAFGAQRSGPGGEPVPDDADAPSAVVGGAAGQDEGDGTPAVGTNPAAAARAWGRFTRNFVVQGSAAEWAECWMADLRVRLRATAPGARQVFFLHDELMVHAPEAQAVDVELALREAAASASRLLFGEVPVDFPVSVGVARDYASAK